MTIPTPLRPYGQGGVFRFGLIERARMQTDRDFRSELDAMDETSAPVDVGSSSAWTQPQSDTGRALAPLFDEVVSAKKAEEETAAKRRVEDGIFGSYWAAAKDYYRKAEQRHAETMQGLTKPLDQIQDESGELFKGFARGAGGTAQVFTRGLEMHADTLGFEGARDALRERNAAGEARQKELQEGAFKPRVGRLADIKKEQFFSDTADWLLASFGEGSGSITAIASAGILSGGNPVLMAPILQTLGVGEVAETLTKEGVDPADHRKLVYIAGAVHGALEYIPGMKQAMAMVKGETVKEFDKYVLSAVARGFLSGGVKEGVTEGMQSVTELGAAALAKTDYRFGAVSDAVIADLSRGLESEIVESFAKGAVAGGPMEASARGVARVRQGAPKDDPAPTAAPAPSGEVQVPRDVSPMLDGEGDGSKPTVRGQKAKNPDLDILRQQIEAARPTAPAASVPEQPQPEASPAVSAVVGEVSRKLAEGKVPTFADIMGVLPKDDRGDPDMGVLVGELDKVGVRAWNGLNDDQRRQIYEAVAPVVQAVEADPRGALEAVGDAVRTVVEAVPGPQSSRAADDILQASQVNFADIKQRLGNSLAVREWRVDNGGLVKAQIKTTTRNGEVKTARLHVTVQQPDGAWTYYRETPTGSFVEEGRGRAQPPTAEQPRREQPAPASTADLRPAFDRVLSSRTKRADWAKTIGASKEQLDALVNEALADGRLKKTKAGGIARTGKKVALPAPATGQTTGQDSAQPVDRTQEQPANKPATRTMDRSAEKRLEAVKSDVARRYASRLIEAGSDLNAVESAIKAMQQNSKVGKGVLAEIVKAYGGVAGKPKTPRAAYGMIRAIAAERAARGENARPEALPEPAGGLPEAGVPDGIQPDAEVGPIGEAPETGGIGSGGPLGDAGVPDAQQPGSPDGVRGEGASPGSDTGTDPRPDQPRTDLAAPADAKPNLGVSEEELAAIREQAAADRIREAEERATRTRSNYRITEEDAIGSGGPKAKIRANLAAIETLKQIEEENRPATEDEKKILVKYVGWGAFSQPMFADYNKEFAKERARLQNLMTPEEYKSARASTINAHYTSPDVIKGMWTALGHLGFKGGRVLEPSAGIGHFIGMQPDAMRETSQWTAVELDTISGRITKALYGGADVRIGGFEAQTWPDDHFDLAISNVPFDKTGPSDPRYKTPFSLHDYFFVKALDKVRPGGIVAFIASSYSMDKTRDVARREMEKRGTFLGAIRLPGGNQGAFKANAGTDVTTDIIFFRKRLSGEPVDLNSEWRDLVEIKTPEGPTQINGYFAAHPEMMLGKMRLIGSMYSKGEPVLIGPTSDIDQRIAEAAQNMPADAMLPAETSATAFADEIDTDLDASVKEGAFYLKDGEIYRRVIGVGVPQKLSKPNADRVRSFMGLRDLVDQLFAAQGGQQTTPEQRNAIRSELSARYDEFVKKFGPINLTHITERVDKKGKTITTRRRPNFSAFEEDPSAYKVAAIELYDEKSNEARKAAIFTEDVIAPYKRPTITGPADALAVSLNETGRVDMKLISEQLGVSEDEAPALMGDSVFLNPKGEQWQTATQYLAGDVVQKLEDAKAAVANGDQRYQKNVDALAKVQPEPLTRVEITVPMGASWVPTEVYEDFVREVMGVEGVSITLNDVTKKWRVSWTRRASGSYDAAQAQWGTDNRSFLTILEATLNSTPIRIETEDADGNKTRDIEAEEAIQAKSTAIYEAFTGQIIPGAPAAIDGWIWQDEERAQRLEALYNQSYNRIVKEQHDGSHLTFPGLAKVVSFPDGSTGTINLTPARTSAIWRIIQNGNTLIDHVVGAGKTWTSIMAVMEMKRLGQIRRPMFVVPNHMLHQFSHEFLQAYPSAKILVADKDSMSKDKRKEFAAKAAAEKWDGIIITHSAFGRIRMQDQAYKDYYEEAIAEMVEAKEAASREEGKGGATVKDIEKAIKALKAKLEKLTTTEAKDEGITFEELGVDHLTVDEAHKFKKLWFMTRHTRVRGLPKKESQRATDLYIKIRHLEKSRPGRSALFLTGTPLSNSMAEIYTMMRFLQHDTLKEYGIGEFDSWAQTFGRIVTKTELAPNGRTFRDATSFSSFVNIPELSTLYGRIADTQTAESLKLPRPTVKGGGPVVVASDLSEGEEKYIQSLIQEMENLKGQKPVKGAPNFLSMFTQGLQIGTDMRLVNPDAPFNPKGKIAKATENILRIWQAGNADSKTPNKAQLVFLDMGVPGSKGKASVAISPATEGGALPPDIEDVRQDIVSAYDVEQETDADEDADADDPNADAKPATEEDAEAKAMLVGKYNLYADIKRRLVAGGVPAEQIEFIHDANTDDKKAKLFEKVRNGDVRILLGSSEKMGVGTNVQKRLIALHHIDSPWTPAEVEQRDGRILRQGNLNKEIEIYRYVTKRSFDSYRWQILETKSNFIGQFRAGARGVRIAEEIDAPLPEAAELKAAATGDPRIVEHADLSRQVRILTAQQSAHAATAVRARQAATQLRKDIEHWQKFVGPYEMDALRVTDLSGDNFKVTISGAGGRKTEVTKRKDAGEAIKRQILSLAQNGWYSREIELELGTISGFEMIGTIKRTSDGLIGASFGIRGTDTYRSAEGFLVNEETNPISLVQRYERLVKEMPSYHQAVVRSIAKAEKDLPRLDELAKGSVFPKQADLDAARKRLDELGRALKPKAPVVEKPIDAATLNTPEDMGDLLSRFGIDPSLYGLGEAKSLASLLKEVKKGESQLLEVDGKLVRKLASLALDIFTVKDGQRLKLFEDRQEFKDGRIRRRDLDSSLGEKLEVGELPEESIGRAIEEELGITKIRQTSGVVSTTIERLSPSFPGLLSRYDIHRASVEVDPEQYQENYVEHQAEKTNVMAWFPVRDGDERSPNIPYSPLSYERREADARKVMEAEAWTKATIPDMSRDTQKQPGFWTPEWKAAREYTTPDGPVVGYDNAVQYLIDSAVAKIPGGQQKMEKKAFVLFGMPGAGKSTIMRSIRERHGAAHMVGDDAKVIIPEYEGGKNSGGVHEEASDTMKAAIARMLANDGNIIVEKLGSSEKSVEKVLAELTAFGYDVTVVHVDVPKALAMERAIGRWKDTGRAVPLKEFDETNLNLPVIMTKLKTDRRIDETAQVTFNEQSDRWEIVAAGLGIEGLWPRTGAVEGVAGLDGVDRQPIVSGSDRRGEASQERDARQVDETSENVTEGPVDPALSDSPLAAQQSLAAIGRAYKTIEQRVKAGASVPISAEVTDAYLEAAILHLDLVPKGIKVGALSAVRPIDPETKKTASWADVVGDFKSLDGSILTVPFILRDFPSYRAGFHRGSGAILFFGISRANLEIGTAEAVMRARIAHEAVHAVWEFLPRAVKKRLFSHAETLGVLDMQLGTLLRSTGEAVAGGPGDAMTLRDIYAKQYDREFDFDDRIQQEAVAHLRELEAAGFFTDAELAPVRKDMDYLADPQALGSDIWASQSAGMLAAVQESKDRSVLARHFGATRIEDIGPNDPHPGRVLAFHGTYSDVDRFDVDRVRDLGVHFGTSEQSGSRLASGTEDGTISDSARTIPAILDLSNVATLTDLNTWSPVQLAQEIEGQVSELSGLSERVRTEAHENDATTQARERRMNVIRDALTGAGIDAIRYQNSTEGPGWSYIVWEPGKVISATSGNMLFALGGSVSNESDIDSSTGQSMRRDLDSLGFYSKALEAARGLKQEKGTPEQMMAQLKKAGVKDAEIEATGLLSLMGLERGSDGVVRRREDFGAPNQPLSAQMATDRSGQTIAASRDRQELDDRGLRQNALSSGSSAYSKYEANPSSLAYREAMQNNLNVVREYFPQGEGYYPAVVVRGDDGVSILDGHNRASIAAERGDALPVVEITQRQYEAAKTVTDDDIDIAHAVLVMSGEDDAASGLRSKFPGTRMLDGAYPIVDAMEGAVGSTTALESDAITLSQNPQQQGDRTASPPRRARLNQISKSDIVKHLEENRVGLSEVVRTPQGYDDIRAIYGRNRDIQQQAIADARNDPALGRVARETDETQFLMDLGRIATGGPPSRLTDIRGTRRAEYDAARRHVAAIRTAREAAQTQTGELGRAQERTTKWEQHSLDPSNPTYRETVIHLPEKGERKITGRETADELAAMRRELDANEREVNIQNFRSGHFPEPNIIGHMMTSMTRHEGKPVYTIDQIQSDWGQKLRDGGVRDEKKLADLKERADKTRAARDAFVRAYQEMLADGDRAKTSLGDANDRLSQLSATGDRYGQEWRRLWNDANIANAEWRTAEAAAVGHPLVNTTDQWTQTTLRRAIRQAVEAGAEYIAIPHGDTVLSYNPGGEDGMRGFYGKPRATPERITELKENLVEQKAEVEAATGVRRENAERRIELIKKQIASAEAVVEGIVPKNLRKLLSTLDKNSPAPVKVKTVDATDGPRGWNRKEEYPFDKSQTGFTLFPITDKVRQSVMEEGQPMFALGGFRPDPEPAGEGSLDKVIQDLKDTLGVVPTQTLMGVTIRAEAKPAPTAAEMNAELGRRESDYRNSPESFMEPDPYFGFRDMAESLPDEVSNRFQVHGIVTGDRSANLLDLLTNGIDPSRGFNSGPPKGGIYGVNSTRSNAPYLIISAPGQMIPQTGVRYVVLNGPAEALKPRLDTSFRDVVFMTVAEADAFMRTGQVPAKPSVGGEVRLNPQSNVRGQTTSATGAVGVRKSRDLQAIAHESAHYLETTLGSEILDLQRDHQADLMQFYDALPDQQFSASEAFAEFFRTYLTNPEGSVALAPDLVAAMEDVLEANGMLDGIHDVQASYQQWRDRATPEQLSSDVVSIYAGNSFADLKADAIMEAMPTRMAQAYTASIDALNPLNKIVRKLLETADRNGVADDEGRPISLKVAENPYKIARMFAGSFATGYGWLTKGIANRGEEATSHPSLTKALEVLFGSNKQRDWDKAMYQTAGQYLISQRALAEYGLLDQKEARLAEIDEILEQGQDAWRQTSLARQDATATLERRETALVRSQTQLRDRRRLLGSAETTLANLQERIQAKKDDVVAAQMARDDALVARRQRDLQILERDSRIAVRKAEALIESVQSLDVDVGLLAAEIDQLRTRVEEATERGRSIEAAMEQLRRERKATEQRGASRRPTAEPREWHQEFIAKVEADPKYARIGEFSQLVRQFAHGLLSIRHQAGLISDEQFEMLSKRKDWYVPFQRDMTDASAEDVFFKGMGMTKKWSPFKKFDGSDRAIINPLEVLSQQAYSVAQQVMFNDATSALADLAERAGPGGASIVEVLTREESAEANEQTFGRIKDMAMAMGIDEADAIDIVNQMEMNFANQELQFIWSPATKGPVQLPTVPVYRNGERVMVRLTDPKFGVETFNALNGMGKELSDFWINGAAKPARWLQAGVTTHPTFMPRNLFRDIWDAWIKTGAVPIFTQIEGAKILYKNGDFLRQYMEAGGILGGRNIAALTKKEQQADVLDLSEKRFSGKSALLGGVAGGLLGTIYGGPIGMTIGAAAGAALGGRYNVLPVVEAVESMTRLGVAAHAYRRAMIHNPDLSHSEAMLEAAFTARDVFDWNRRGSKMLTAVRLVTFLNAQLQGLDAASRRLGGDNDRGSALAKHLGIVWRREHGVTLSADEQRAVGDAYKTMVRMSLYTGLLTALYFLATSGDDDDRDKQYQDIKDKTKFTHSWLPDIWGTSLRLPKAFEWAVPANMIEALADKIRGRDPRLAERIGAGVYEVMIPPAVPQVATLVMGLAADVDVRTLNPFRKEENRDLVGSSLQRLDPESQFDAFSSQLAIDIARAMAKAGVPRDDIPSPKKIDFILRSGGYWGQDIAKGYGIVKEGFGGRPREEARASDLPVIGGFTGVAARQSRSREEMFKLMSQSGGRLTTAANTYKDYLDQQGVPDEAARYLANLEPEERAYAILKYHGPSGEQRNHPMERLTAIDGVANKIRKDIILDRLTPIRKEGRRSVRDFEDKVTLSPRKQTEIHDILERLMQAESWNTMVAMDRRGWQGRKEFAVQPILDELKASSPEVFALYEDRLQKTRARSFDDVKQEWPQLRERILREGPGAF